MVFAGTGDEVDASPAGTLTLTVEGPEAGLLATEPDNLVLRAARMLAEAAGVPAGAAFRLRKRLPVASGIGGGSADAAAALRVLNRLWGLGWSEERLASLAATLGADVPCCVASAPCRMGGVGEMLGPAPRLPACGLVLANPRVPLPTPAVFRARRQAEFSPEATLPESWGDTAALAAGLAVLGNDLEAAAIGLCPVVAEVLAALQALPGCLLARMSGSGATCFGLFTSTTQATAAAASLPAGWWRWGGGLHATGQ